ncbi:hypothetical protein ACR2U9_25980, partial [Klebsiella pneumoniae]
MGLQRHRTACRCILPAFSTAPATQKEAAKCAAGAGAHKGVRLENGIYGHSRFCNTDFDDKLAC